MGTAYSISSLLEPTKEMQRALGEVTSLGVADDTLNKLRDTALKFSTQYGGSAADVVRSSYEIQSAISGLSGNELVDIKNHAIDLAGRFLEMIGVFSLVDKAMAAWDALKG